MRLFITLIACILAFYALNVLSVYAESTSVFYKELNLLGGYSDMDGFIDETMMLKNAIGAEYFRRFSGEQGDYLTLDIQPRLTYKPTKKFKDAWSFEVHNAWLEYKLGLGYKLRVGHFDPSFGLEPISDTHGTILQTLAMKNVGFKSDWGIGFRGIARLFDYEASIQNGSGMKIKRNDGNFLLTYRMGNPQGNNFLYGFSVLYGKVLGDDGMQDSMPATMSDSDMPDKPILKKRIGVDLQYPLRSFLVKGELAYGRDDKDNVLGSFLQLDYTFPFHQALLAELQLQNWHSGLGIDGMMDTTITSCLSYKLTSKLTARVAYFHTFDKDNQIFIQLYYFGI
jgi:hypothetical protein